MERVGALACLAGLGVGGELVGAAHVQRYRLQRSAAVLAEQVVELFEHRVVAALAGPDDRAVAVVVGDHGHR